MGNRRRGRMVVLDATGRGGAGSGLGGGDRPRAMEDLRGVPRGAAPAHNAPVRGSSPR